MNASTNSLNVDNSILHNEGNEYGNIAIPVIGKIFEKDYIHVLYGLLNQYIYGYLI